MLRAPMVRLGGPPPDWVSVADDGVDPSSARHGTDLLMSRLDVLVSARHPTLCAASSSMSCLGLPS